ncbi:C-C motif chemokine 27a [Platichthys flesus]|uniref:C-C motif chemokine 27a n=1 Tax=Platichthys flesus TaxID=8260 RepID=UPI002DBFFE78|nr:C-C motif chemokine 27a [Platichthys flesus]
MDLKVALVAVCLFALAITCTEAVIPTCCIKTSRHMNKHYLMKVEKWYVQEGSGACDISALILYVKGREKPLCAPLKVKTTLERLQQRRKRHNLKAAH